MNQQSESVTQILKRVAVFAMLGKPCKSNSRYSGGKNALFVSFRADTKGKMSNQQNDFFGISHFWISREPID